MVGEPLFVPDFEASLVYRGSSKVARDDMEKPCLENKNKEEEEEEEEEKEEEEE